MDKVSAKLQLLKDIDALITHINDIIDSETVAIDNQAADYLLSQSEDIKEVITNDLVLKDAAELEQSKKVDGKAIDPDDEDAWEKLFKNFHVADDDSDTSYSSPNPCGGSFNFDGGCGSSSSSSSDSCGGSFHGRGC